MTMVKNLVVEVPGVDGSNEWLEAVDDDVWNSEIRKDGGRK